MADTPTPTPPTPAPDQPPPDHAVLRALVQRLRGVGVTDTQTAREVHLSEEDAKQMADALEQMAQRLEAHATPVRPGQPAAKPPA